jgi:hypothetical protein
MGKGSVERIAFLYVVLLLSSHTLQLTDIKYLIR